MRHLFNRVLVAISLFCLAGLAMAQEAATEAETLEAIPQGLDILFLLMGLGAIFAIGGVMFLREQQANRTEA